MLKKSIGKKHEVSTFSLELLDILQRNRSDRNYEILKKYMKEQNLKPRLLIEKELNELLTNIGYNLATTRKCSIDINIEDDGSCKLFRSHGLICMGCTMGKWMNLYDITKVTSNRWFKRTFIETMTFPVVDLTK